MTRLIAALIVTAAVAGCADTTTVASRSAPLADPGPTTMDNLFFGVLPQ